MSFEEKSIRAGNLHVSYFDEGRALSPESPPIILIHGFPFSKEIWESQIKFLQRSYRVIAYDIRGFGNSDAGSKEFTMICFAKDLFRFMDKLNIEKAILCGLSMGGYVALTGLTENEQRIAGLVINSSQCVADTEDQRKERYETIEKIRANGIDDFAHQFVQKLFCVGSLAEKRDEVSLVERMIKGTNVETICKTMEAMANRGETCSVLYLVDTPVMIIAGEDDCVISVETAKKMHDSMPDSMLRIIPGTGHLCHLEASEQFNIYLLEFLQSIQAGALVRK